MNCHNIKMRILEGGLSAAEQAHLEQCADCMDYSRTVNRVHDQIDHVEVPEHLDHMILSYARQQNRVGRVKRVIYLKLVASAAAAVLAILVGIEAYRRWQPPAPKDNNRIVQDDRPQAPVPQLPPRAPEQLHKAPERKTPEVVADFDWENDPIDADLSEIQAEFLLLTADDEAAAVVSKLIE